MVATALTDAVYVMFTNSVVKRRRLPAASWSSIWYLLSSFAVINYTQHWFYVVFAAAGSFRYFARFSSYSSSNNATSASTGVRATQSRKPCATPVAFSRRTWPLEVSKNRQPGL